MRSFWIESVLDRYNLFQTDTINSVNCFIKKDMVRVKTIKIKNEKAEGPSGVVSEMVRGRKEGVNMITELVNQIIVEGVIQA